MDLFLFGQVCWAVAKYVTDCHKREALSKVRIYYRSALYLYYGIIIFKEYLK